MKLMHLKGENFFCGRIFLFLFIENNADEIIDLIVKLKTLIMNFLFIEQAEHTTKKSLVTSKNNDFCFKIKPMKMKLKHNKSMQCIDKERDICVQMPHIKANKQKILG